jgi:hypothetical protein
MTSTTLEDEHAHLIAGDGEVDLVPFPFRHALPGDQDALFGEGASRVLVGSELGDATGSFEFTLVVVLFSEGEEESLLSVLDVLVTR